MNHKGKAAGQGGWIAPPGGRTSDAAGLLGGRAILGTCTHELVGMEPMVGAAGGLPLLRAGLPPCGGAIGMPIISGTYTKTRTMEAWAVRTAVGGEVSAMGRWRWLNGLRRVCAGVCVHMLRVLCEQLVRESLKQQDFEVGPNEKQKHKRERKGIAGDSHAKGDGSVRGVDVTKQR